MANFEQKSKFYREGTTRTCQYPSRWEGISQGNTAFPHPCALLCFLLQSPKYGGLQTNAENKIHTVSRCRCRILQGRVSNPFKLQNSTFWTYIFFFQKRHPNQKGRCPDTLDITGSTTGS